MVSCCLILSIVQKASINISSDIFSSAEENDLQINIDKNTFVWGGIQSWSSEDVKDEEQHRRSHGAELWRQQGECQFLGAPTGIQPTTAIKRLRCCHSLNVFWKQW